jgi:hypothetical protein
LRVLRRQVGRPRLRRRDRLFMAAISRTLPRARWSSFVVSPNTLLRWHRELVRRKWTFRRASTAGRPPDPQRPRRWPNFAALVRPPESDQSPRDHAIPSTTGARTSSDATPASSVDPGRLTCGVRVHKVFPSPRPSRIEIAVRAPDGTSLLPAPTRLADVAPFVRFGPGAPTHTVVQ